MFTREEVELLEMIGVVNSDQVNKHNIKFTVGALESAYDSNWEQGIPSFLGHDHTKPIAWTFVKALYFEPGLVRTTNVTHIPETEKESIGIGEKINHYYTSKTDEFIKPYKDKLLKLCSTFLSASYKFYATDSAAIVDEGIVRRIFPEIFETDDKHGLVCLSKLNPVSPGIYEKNGLLLYASQYFRRSFSRLNTLNTPFLQRLQAIGTTDRVTTKIFLDPDMIGLAGSHYEVLEFQYWWGPKFTENLNDIPLGVTTHKTSEKQMFFNDIQSTEFWWYEQDGKKTLECEEVVVKPSFDLNTSNYGCRYVHSMISEATSTPFHLDGAIRRYDEDRIINRWDSDIKNAGKDTVYCKLWRLDGDITVSEWKELITHFYRDNTLIGEYFGGEDPQKSFQPEILENSDGNGLDLSNYSPSYMKKGDGVRVSISYGNLRNSKNNKREIISPHTFNEFIYIETDTIEIIKRLRKRGESIKISSNIKMIAYEDLVTNFPIITHKGRNAVTDANVTLEVILDLCESWKAKFDDRTISVNIAIEYEKKEILFSFAGQIEDILVLFKSNNMQFPNQESEMGSWCEKLAENLTEKFSKSNDDPKLHKILKKSGILYFDRVFLEKDYELYWDKGKNTVGVNLKIPKNEESLLANIMNGSLQLAPIYLVNKSKCSKCNREYKSCNCTKYSDNNIYEKMEDIKNLGIFWTRRKA